MSYQDPPREENPANEEVGAGTSTAGETTMAPSTDTSNVESTGSSSTTNAGTMLDQSAELSSSPRTSPRMISPVAPPSPVRAPSETHIQPTPSQPPSLCRDCGRHTITSSMISLICECQTKPLAESPKREEALDPGMPTSSVLPTIPQSISIGEGAATLAGKGKGKAKEEPISLPLEPITSPTSSNTASSVQSPYASTSVTPGHSAQPSSSTDITTDDEQMPKRSKAQTLLTDAASRYERTQGISRRNTAAPIYLPMNLERSSRYEIGDLARALNDTTVIAAGGEMPRTSNTEPSNQGIVNTARPPPSSTAGIGSSRGALPSPDPPTFAEVQMQKLEESTTPPPTFAEAQRANNPPGYLHVYPGDEHIQGQSSTATPLARLDRNYPDRNHPMLARRPGMIPVARSPPQSPPPRSPSPQNEHGKIETCFRCMTGNVNDTCRCCNLM